MSAARQQDGTTAPAIRPRTIERFPAAPFRPAVASHAMGRTVPTEPVLPRPASEKATLITMSANLFQIAGLSLCTAVLGWAAALVRQSLAERRSNRACFRQRHAQLHRQVATVTSSAKSESPAWHGMRPFRIKWKVRESRDCHSLVLTPCDAQPLPPFQPGQYITISVPLPETAQRVVRCYSLSSHPNQEYYRITVKKIVRNDGAAGQASGYLNDLVSEGDTLDVAAPRGRFRLNRNNRRAVALLAAGIGVTPLYCMLDELLNESPKRDIAFFYGVRNGREHTFKQRLGQIRHRYPQLLFCTCYSQPRPEDRHGIDFDVKGRLTIDLLRRRLPSTNFDFYLCGPADFTAALVAGLRAWSVPEESIRYELFQPSRWKRAGRNSRSRANSTAAIAQPLVHFTRSQKSIFWTGHQDNLLELAESAGIPLPSGCRAGNCGTCKIPVRRGNFCHTTQPGAAVEPGSCLACIAVPTGSMEVDT